MHPSSLENMEKCYNRYVRGAFLDSRETVAVLDVGAADINGSYRRVFADPRIRYIGADLNPAKGVDLVLEDPHQLPIVTDSVDVVISGQVFEHCEFFWVLFKEMIRVLRPNGLLFLIAPSTGPIHRYPVDCYRFYPDAYSALAKYADCYLIDSWLDERGPWRDLVGVFAKQDRVDRRKTVEDTEADLPPRAETHISGPPDAEILRGKEPYLDTLRRIHHRLDPRLYLEVGVRDGESLALANCESVGIDPAYAGHIVRSSSVQLFRTTSDDFFEDEAKNILQQPVDLAFIDGMHLFEYVLRDFMNIERYSHESTLVVIDDVFPNHPLQSTRTRKTRAWTGDVWKIGACLRLYRPDLTLLPLDVHPTGLLLVAGLDRENRVLWDQYNPLVHHFLTAAELQSPPSATLARSGSLAPKSIRVHRFLSSLRRLRAAATSLAEAQSVLKRFHVWTL